HPFSRPLSAPSSAPTPKPPRDEDAKPRVSSETAGLPRLTSGPTDIEVLHVAAGSASPALATLSVDVENVLATLTPRERRVLQLRYGFVDSPERTVEEVGKRM